MAHILKLHLQYVSYVPSDVRLIVNHELEGMVQKTVVAYITHLLISLFLDFFTKMATYFPDVYNTVADFVEAEKVNL
jgi:hypothetical protein